jgi:hypothetical protein
VGNHIPTSEGNFLSTYSRAPEKFFIYWPIFEEGT